MDEEMNEEVDEEFEEMDELMCEGSDDDLGMIQETEDDM